MANFNKIILVGNITRDPQLRYLPSQMAVVDFGLAVNHKYRTKNGEDREEVLFIDCSCFGKGAETINQYCTKGKPLLVEGRLKYDSWEDKQGGGKRSKHSVMVDNFQFLGSRDVDRSSGQGEAYEPNGTDTTPARQRPPTQSSGFSTRASRAADAKPEAPPRPFDDSEQFKEDDIPF